MKKEVAVSELCSEDGTGTDNEGVEYHYSYHVPQIEDDTADAAAINQEIAAYYGNRAMDGQLCMENGEPPACCTVSYESYRCGDVLALVVTCAYYYDNYEEYSVYNYDTANGVRLANEDLLAMRGVTQALLAQNMQPTLYADADYPASNACYRSVGYEKRGEIVTVADA